MVGKTNIVGEGSFGPTIAEIQVTYPQGSIVTCTDGTTILVLEDDSGAGTFKVPNIGTWTVTATQDSNMKSQEVEITSKGQIVSISISYFEAYIKVIVNGAPGSTALSCSDRNNAYNYTLSANGDYTFTVYNTGTWTITGVRSNQTRTATVNVTTNGAIYTVTLSYDLVLFDNGTTHSSVGGWDTTTAPDSTYFGIGVNANIYLQSYSNIGNGAALYSKNKINMSGYSKICFLYKVTSLGNAYNQFGLSNTRAGVKDLNLATIYKETTTSSNYKTAKISLAGLQSSYYLYFGVQYYGDLYVNRVWLEK